MAEEIEYRGKSLPKAHLFSYLALCIGILCLGFSAIFVRWAGAPGVVTSFYRMAIAAILMAWPFFYQQKSMKIEGQGGLRRRDIWVAMVGGLFFAGDLSLWATGVNLSGATNPTLLANAAPLWVGLGTLIFFRERLKATFWAGLALGLVGTAVTLGVDSMRSATFGLGALLGLFASVFYGGYFLVTQRGRETMDSLTYFWISAISTAVALLALSLLLHQPLLGYSTRTYLNFLAMGLVTQILGYLSINFALGYLPASVVSPTMLGQPVITALLAVVLLGESISVWQILGSLTVLGGVYLVHFSRRSRI